MSWAELFAMLRELATQPAVVTVIFLVVLFAIALAVLVVQQMGATDEMPQPTAKPAAPVHQADHLSPTRRATIDSQARAAARQDFADNRHRRANPYRHHSREFACWAIAYGEAWLGFELAAHPESKPVPLARADAA